MLIGVPKEVKTHEYRVGLVPGSVRELVHHGHKVVVEAGAGTEIGFDDAAYEAAGADILSGAAEVFGAAELIVKVKEPQPREVALLRAGTSSVHVSASGCGQSAGSRADPIGRYRRRL